MLPDFPEFALTASLPSIASPFFSVTKSPMDGAKSIGIRLAVWSQSLEFFIPDDKCIRLGTATAVDIAWLDVDIIEVVDNVIDTAIKAIEDRVATLVLLRILLLWTIGFPTTPLIAATTKDGILII